MSNRRLITIVGLVAAMTAGCLGAEPPITCLCFTPDASSVVAGSQAGVRVFSWPGLELRATHPVSAPNLHDLAFSPGGDRLAVAGGIPAENGTIEILSWPSGQSLRIIDQHLDSVMAVRWINDQTLASASLDHNVLILDSQTGKRRLTLKGHSRGVCALDVLGDQNLLVSAGIDQSLRVWDTQTGQLVRSLAIHVQPVTSLSMQPDVDGLPVIASASEDRTVRFWQPTIGRMIRFARLPSRPQDIHWLADASAVIACCDDGHVYLVNPETVDVTVDRTAFNGYAYAVAVHPTDGSIIVGGSDGAMQRLCDVSSVPAP